MKIYAPVLRKHLGPPAMYRNRLRRNRLSGVLRVGLIGRDASAVPPVNCSLAAFLLYYTRGWLTPLKESAVS